MNRNFLASLLMICFLMTGIQKSCGQAFSDTTQYDIIDYTRRIFHLEQKQDTSVSDKKVRMSLVPFASASGGGISISTVNLAFYRGDPGSTNLSTVYFYP